MKICIVSGTNREGSNTLRLTKAIAQRYATIEGVEIDLVDLRDLPKGLLDPSSYATRPDGWAPLEAKVLGADGLHVVVPEYNGSMPGALKLFIDHLPFPAAFERRPVCFTGLASGMWGGLRPVEHLQGVFGYRNALQYPERVFIPKVGGALDASGWPTPELTAELLQAQVEGFLAYCRAVGGLPKP